jgi:hypothetical protein
MEQIAGIFQAIGIFIVFPSIIGFIIVGSFLIWHRRTSTKRNITNLVCSINSDCPPGFVCVNGHCVPAQS